MTILKPNKTSLLWGGIGLAGGIVLMLVVGSYRPHPMSGRIVYNKDFGTGSLVYAMNPDGSHTIQIDRITEGYSPTWAPKGQRFAYGCNLDNANICLTDETGPYGSGQRNYQTLINWNNIPPDFCDQEAGEIGRSISWAADGQRLAFTCQNEAGHGSRLVCILDLKQNVSCWETTLASAISQISWSPTAEQLALGMSDASIYLVSPTGQNPTFLTTGTSPAWSPDGKRIAFINAEKIFTIQPEGGQLQEIIGPIPEPDEYIRKVSPVISLNANGKLAWAPDGQKIAFVAGYPHNGIYVVDLPSKNLGLLTVLGDGSFSSPDWSP